MQINQLTVDPLIWELGWALFAGLIAALAAGLRKGLEVFVYHFYVRFQLWRTRLLPWNLVAFLDEAAERRLLCKVGGGYIFVHKLLLNYFADLDEAIADECATTEEQV